MELVDPLIGKELGNYRLDLRLGQGSCGVVYRGEHVKLGTPFAVKILHPILANNEESAARFLREAQTAARISHENVVFIADFDIEPGIGPYFVMEFLDGRSLREALNAEAPLDSERLVNICEQICQPLAVAHRAGVIHRDLKPENICLLMRNGKERVKILDFGIAKITRDSFPEARELTRSGRVLGTPRYFSPEQAQGKEIDHRSDIYSFGIILYEMLTGRPTFDGNTPEEMILQHLTMKPPPLDPERFPDELEDLVAWMLAKKPTDRPDDMDEVWALLKEALPQIRDDVKMSPPPPQPSMLATSLQMLNSRAPAVDGTSGYASDDSDLQIPITNQTIPLGTDPAKLGQLNTLSAVEMAYLDQESTVLEKEPPSSLQKAVQAQAARSKLQNEAATVATPSPARTKPGSSPTIDPTMPSEFFEPPDDDKEESTALYKQAQALTVEDVHPPPNNELNPADAPGADNVLPEGETTQNKTEEQEPSDFSHLPPPQALPAPQAMPPGPPKLNQAMVPPPPRSIQGPPPPPQMPGGMRPGQPPPHPEATASHRARPVPVMLPPSQAAPPLPPSPQVIRAMTPHTSSFSLDQRTSSFQPSGLAPDARMTGRESSAPKTQAEVDALLDDSPFLMSQSGWQPEETFFLSPKDYPVRFLIFCICTGMLGWWAYRVVVPAPPATAQKIINRGPCYARIRIKTTPSDAEIWLNNQRLGRTPYLYRDRCSKRITFQLRHPSYGRQPHIVQLQEGESEVTIPLYRTQVIKRAVEPKPRRRKRRRRRRRRYHTILLQTHPSGARVYYRGRRLCRTPCRLRGRLYRRRRYRLRLRGYRSRSIRVRFSHRRTRYRYGLRRR